MKTILVLSILFCAIAMSARGELTDADLDKIRLIVNDSEKRVREEIKAVDARVQNVEKDVSWFRGKLDGIDKQIAHATNVTYGLIALIVLAVGIPQLIIAWRSGKDRSLERQVETLAQEIETLKQQHILRP